MVLQSTCSRKWLTVQSLIQRGKMSKQFWLCLEKCAFYKMRQRLQNKSMWIEITFGMSVDMFFGFFFNLYLVRRHVFTQAAWLVISLLVRSIESSVVFFIIFILFIFYQSRYFISCFFFGIKVFSFWFLFSFYVIFYLFMYLCIYLFFTCFQFLNETSKFFQLYFF